MKLIITFALIIFASFTSCAQKNETTTYYFIRHAEKDRSNPSDRNPHLNQKGQERASNWTTILGNVKFDAVYSTDYNRTIETAKPTADKNNVEIKLYDPTKINAPEWFLNETKGRTVLVVGHSDTTPAFVNAIIGQKKYDNIDDNVNDNLFIVTINGSDINDELITAN